MLVLPKDKLFFCQIVSDTLKQFTCNVNDKNGPIFIKQNIGNSIHHLTTVAAALNKLQSTNSKDKVQRQSTNLKHLVSFLLMRSSIPSCAFM